MRNLLSLLDSQSWARMIFQMFWGRITSSLIILFNIAQTQSYEFRSFCFVSVSFFFRYISCFSNQFFQYHLKEWIDRARFILLGNLLLSSIINQCVTDFSNDHIWINSIVSVYTALVVYQDLQSFLNTKICKNDSSVSSVSLDYQFFCQVRNSWIDKLSNLRAFLNHQLWF